MGRYTFFLLALAVWRISNMLVKEDGPSHIFERMRYRLGVRRDKEDPDITYAKDPDSFFATLLLCPWCLSIWVAGFFVGIFLLSRRLARWLSYIPALSAITCLIDTGINSLENK